MFRRILLGSFFCFENRNEKSVDFQWTTRRHISEDRIVHNHCSENVKSFIKWNIFLRRLRRALVCMCVLFIYTYVGTVVRICYSDHVSTSIRKSRH
jgi:hypothetical protein